MCCCCVWTRSPTERVFVHGKQRVANCVFSLFTSPSSLWSAEETGRYVHQPRPGEEAGHRLRVRHGQAHATRDTGLLNLEFLTLCPAELLLTPPFLLLVLDSWDRFHLLRHTSLLVITCTWCDDLSVCCRGTVDEMLELNHEFRFPDISFGCADFQL